MATPESTSTVIPTLLDRLCDQETTPSERLPELSRKEIKKLKDSVLRDLRFLLNARNTFAEGNAILVEPERRALGPEFVEARSSVLAYGLPDFTGYNSASSDNRLTLCEAIARAIAYFEPRLTDVSIVPETPRAADESTPRTAGGNNRVVYVRLSATLGLGMLQEPIALDITMPVSSGAYEIRDAS